MGAALVSCAAPSVDIFSPDDRAAGDIAALNALAPADVGTRPVRSGAWSDPGVWGGAVPSSGAVVIPKGTGVIIDMELAGAYASVRVDGCLEFSQAQNTRLRTDLLFVAPGGEIWIGSQSRPIEAGAKAAVTFPASGAIDVARDPKLFGKGFVSASKTTIVGAAKTSKLRAVVAPLKGATTIALEQAPEGWSVGDRLVLTGTYWVKFRAPPGAIKRADGAQDEELTLTAINGASVTVSPALRFDHDGPRADLLPYLVNFSRNIRFETEGAASLPPSERAHAMFMSPQTVIRSAAFREMGRTDKSRRAVSVGSLAVVAPTSNIKGRYPLHLHKAEHAARHPDVRNVAVWGSPGWGIAQHSGRALLYDNAVYDAFGAAFVAESGDETGAWISNVAIKSEGVAEIAKDAASVAAFDLARTGDGYWLQGRLVHLHRNVAAGMGGGNGFIFMHRGSDLPVNPIDGSMTLQPASLRFIPRGVEDPNIQQFTDNEVFASESGFHVVKSDPRQPHDSRTVIDNLRAWEVGTGVHLSYVSGYTVIGADLVGARLRPSAEGVLFGQNTLDLAVVDSRIADFATGVAFAHDWTTSFAAAAGYVSAGNVFARIGGAEHLNADASDIVNTSTPSGTTPKLMFDWGGSPPRWDGSPGDHPLVVSGTKTDSLGAAPFPVAPGAHRFGDASVTALLSRFGYYQLKDGRRVAVAPEHFSDRATGAIELADIVFEIDPAFSLARFTNNGALDLAAPAPTPRDDSAAVAREGSVVVDVLDNDGAGGPFTLMGMTAPREGFVEATADGRIRYEPYPDFEGDDSFSYWVRGAKGRVAKASVTVSVR